MLCPYETPHEYLHTTVYHPAEDNQALLTAPIDKGRKIRSE